MQEFLECREQEEMHLIFEYLDEDLAKCLEAKFQDGMPAELVKSCTMQARAYTCEDPRAGGDYKSALVPQPAAHPS